MNRLPGLPAALSEWVPRDLYRLVFFFIFLCFNNVRGYAQNKYIVDGYWVENYTKKNGLPEDIVIDITQDKKGYLWMTTPYSLVRFDGYEFKTFNPRKQFPDMQLHFSPPIIEDDDGLIWASTFDQGVLCFDPRTGKFQRYLHDTSTRNFNSYEVTAIKQDSRKNLWVSTTMGLRRITKKGDSINIQVFKVGLPESVLKKLAVLSRTVYLRAAISKPGDLMEKTLPFRVNRKGEFLISSMGEASGLMFDYGWIENSRGIKIWEHIVSKSYHAGGSIKNKVQLDILSLDTGNYRLHYKSDDSHSWNAWNSDAPSEPRLWGIHLFHLNNDDLQFFKLQIQKARASKGTQGEFIKKIFLDSKQTLWALTDAGLEKLDITNAEKGEIKSQIISLPAWFNSGFNISEITRGRLMIQGFYFDSLKKSFLTVIAEYDPASGKVKFHKQDFNLSSPEYGNSIVMDKSNGYWFSTFDSKGLGLYYANGHDSLLKFRRIDIAPPGTSKDGKPPFEQIWSIFKDRSGYVWVGSRQYALYKIRPEKAVVKFIPADTSNYVLMVGDYLEMMEDVTGDVWVLSKSKGLLKFLSKENRFIQVKNITVNTDRFHFFKAPDGSVIINNGSFFFVNKTGTVEFTKLPQTVPDSLIVLSIDGKGRYWALKRNRPTDLTFFVSDKGKFKSIRGAKTDVTRVIRYFTIKNNRIWIAPSFGGVQQYEYEDQSDSLKFIGQYLREGIDVYSVYIDKEGIAWMGTYDDGLVRLDPVTKKYESFKKEQGLPSNFVYKVYPSRNNLWVITDLGTAFFNKMTKRFEVNKELNDFITQHARFENQWFGIQNIFYDQVTPLSPDKFVFAANRGIAIFDPADLKTDTVKPIVHITSLNVDGENKEIPAYGYHYKLAHNKNDLEIQYISLHYDHPGKNTFAYLLENADNDWVQAGMDKRARYSNLEPGTYTFYLKSANADGIWSDPQEMFSITIRPPWWKTWWAYTIFFLLIAVGFWTFTVYRSRRLRWENVLLEKKVSERTVELNESIRELKATQTQLIQSEKMASLGELTAGIAHEIQNPLNFVNNFSELNTELIDELNQEIDQKNWQQAKEISSSLKENEEKIVYHGKRAESIVKSMLQHSRSNTGKKEMVDINVLLDEYLRLAYHGLRAKDKSFQAKFETEFDPQAGQIEIAPQDLGRVFLNLLNNAFYAVTEKSRGYKTTTDFEPLVKVKTERQNGFLNISVIDNGNGIDKEHIEKIFQPFFTTKPTGQGTGLGLSMSYEIIKALGGEIKLTTNKGEGTEFIVQIPVG